MDLVSVDPMLNMYDEAWPLRSHQPNVPPPKFVFSGQTDDKRRGVALDSIVCGGSIVSGGEVEHSILGPRVRVNSFSQVKDSILFEGVDIGRNSRVCNAIIDKGVKIPADTEIGVDLELDRRRGFTISPGGIVVIAKGDAVESMVRAEREQVA